MNTLIADINSGFEAAVRAVVIVAQAVSDERAWAMPVIVPCVACLAALCGAMKLWKEDKEDE